MANNTYYIYEDENKKPLYRQVRYYRDGNTIDTTSTSYQAYSSIQGMAVDYLTRFMCGFPVEKDGPACISVNPKPRTH